MQHRSVILMLGLAGCSSGLLQEVTTPPSGLSVTVTSSFSAGIVPTSGSIVGKGDSVVAIVSRPATCGRTLTADAGNNASGLVVTILLTAEAPQNCLPLNGMTTYRAVVHGVPAGTYDATAHVRLETLGAQADTTVAQATIKLP